MPDRTPYLQEPTPGRSLPKSLDDRTRERSSFYGSRRWAEHRRAFLATHPLCARCLVGGKVVSARIVHHITERLDNPALAWAWTNFEALCSPCHTRHHNEKKKNHDGK